MMRQRSLTVFVVFFSLLFLKVATGNCEQNLQERLNDYFVQLDADFAKVADAGAVRSTSLRPAERLFVREMRKNQAYTIFLRTNSKGVVISEVVRGEKVERPMRSVSDQRWFQVVSKKNEAYYSLIKDTDRGRYYLLWTRPILKRGDRFVGAVAVKIDLWDSFYEFSNSMYVPFLVKLGRKSLFSHKWENGLIGAEKPLTIQGIDRISVIYIQEKKQPSTVAQKDTAVTAAPVAASTVQNKEPPKTSKKKGGGGLLVFLLVLLFGGIGIASFMLVAWMRRRALLKRIDEDDPLL
ncbi:MAG: hypothetical protein JW863_22605 [Chitinispirillaceae bacterium]|nr:hypothetical protein [Chitinispirillaceae bacterium]